MIHRSRRALEQIVYLGADSVEPAKRAANLLGWCYSQTVVTDNGDGWSGVTGRPVAVQWSVQYIDKQRTERIYPWCGQHQQTRPDRTVHRQLSIPADANEFDLGLHSSRRDALMSTTHCSFWWRHYSSRQNVRFAEPSKPTDAVQV